MAQNTQPHAPVSTRTWRAGDLGQAYYAHTIAIMIRLCVPLIGEVGRIVSCSIGSRGPAQVGPFPFSQPAEPRYCQ